jgi:hypothetical protein
MIATSDAPRRSSLVIGGVTAHATGVAKEADMPHFSGRALAAGFMVAVWTLALLVEIGAF